MTTGPQKLRDLANYEDDTKSLWKLPNGRHVIVSRIIACDHGGWETMIFPCDETGYNRTGGSIYETRYFESHSQSITNLLKDVYA